MLIGEHNVKKMVIKLAGSGAISKLCYCCWCSQRWYSRIKKQHIFSLHV